MLNQDHCRPAKLIVCILGRGAAQAIVEQLFEEKILLTETLVIRNQNALVAEEAWQEMDMLKVIVEPQFADHVFELIYNLSAIELEEGHYMYQHNVPWVTHFELPKLPKEGVSIKAIESGKVEVEGMTLEQLQTLRIRSKKG